MTDEAAPRFSLWFRAWWPALLGVVVAAGGGVLWLATRLPPAVAFGWFAYQPLPRGMYTYDASGPVSSTYSYSALAHVVHLSGIVLFIGGLVVAAAALGYRLGRARS